MKERFVNVRAWSAFALGARTWRNAGAIFSLGVRLATLLCAPLLALVVTAGFLMSSQGREALVLLTESRLGWLGIVLPASIFLGLVITASCNFVLKAYSVRTRERLQGLCTNPEVTARQLRYWLSWTIGLGGILVAFSLNLGIGWTLWIVEAALLALAWWVVRHPPALLVFVHRRTRLPGLLLIGATIVLGLLLGFADMPWLREQLYVLGPFVIIVAGLAFWTALVSILMVALPIRAGLPSMLLLPIFLAAWWSGRSDYNDITVETVESSQPAGQSACEQLTGDKWPASKAQARRELPECNPLPFLPAYYRDWLLRLPSDPDDDYIPVFLVAAEGGGIRAAYWTASLLEQLDRETEGRFSRHVFAISGVSGGTVGMLAHYDQIKQRAAGNPIHGDAVRTLFRKDLLSPLVYGLLFPDAMRNLVGTKPVRVPSRANLFEEALATSWQNVSGSDAFKQPFLKSFAADAEKGLPVLIANATVAESGQRFLASNVALNPENFPSAYVAFDPAAPYALSHLTGAQVAHLSARFPFLSPAASIRSPPSMIAGSINWKTTGNQPLWGHIVDGGYFENSGATTLLDVLHVLQRSEEDSWSAYGRGSSATTDSAFLERVRKVRFYVLSIRNDPFDFNMVLPTHPREPPTPVMLQESDNDRLARWSGRSVSARPPAYSYFDVFSELGAPPTAMISTREARGSASRTALEWAVSGTSSASSDCRATSSDQNLATSFGCDRYAGRWLEVNLAAAIYDDRDKYKCGGNDFRSLRPALGWVLETGSADFMDCLGREAENVNFVRSRVRIILESLKRSAMEPEAYQLVEGWQRKWNCGLNAGQVRLSKNISRNGSAPPVPDDPRCALERQKEMEQHPSFNYVPKKSVNLKCEEITGQVQLDAWLSVGALDGDEAYVRCLLKRGANPNVQDTFNITSLLYAISNRHKEVALVLLKAGAQVNVRSTEGMTVMLAAAGWADTTLVNELIERGADIQQPAKTGVTPLMLAASKCKTDVVRILIAKGANPSTKDENGRDAQAWSNLSGCPEMAGELKKISNATTR